jgi:hypothetical protein
MAGGQEVPIEENANLAFNYKIRTKEDIENDIEDLAEEEEEMVDTYTQRPLTSEEILNQEIDMAFSRVGTGEQAEDDWHIEIQGKPKPIERLEGTENETGKLVSIDNLLPIEDVRAPPMESTLTSEPQKASVAVSSSSKPSTPKSPQAEPVAVKPLGEVAPDSSAPNQS